MCERTLRFQTALLVLVGLLLGGMTRAVQAQSSLGCQTVDRSSVAVEATADAGGNALLYVVAAAGTFPSSTSEGDFTVSSSDVSVSIDDRIAGDNSGDGVNRFYYFLDKNAASVSSGDDITFTRQDSQAGTFTACVVSVSGTSGFGEVASSNAPSANDTRSAGPIQASDESIVIGGLSLGNTGSTITSVTGRPTSAVVTPAGGTGRLALYSGSGTGNDVEVTFNYTPRQFSTASIVTLKPPTGDPPTVALTDGSSEGRDFSPNVSPGTDNNKIGILELEAGKSGASLDGLDVATGAAGISGIEAAHLYWSEDPTPDPGTDTQLDAITGISGLPATLTFDGFSTSIPTSARYAIVTVDTAPDASASGVQFQLSQTSSLSLTNAELGTVNGASSFSPPFPLADNPTTLPVELAGLDAQTTGSDAVRLQWRTASETGNAGFDIQRRVEASRTPGMTSGPQDASPPVEDWQTVGSVEGAGTTTEPQSYTFTDEGLPYDTDSLSYRLKQIDTDGSVSYSEAVTVVRSAVEQVQLLGTYPNPARSRATVDFAVPEGASDTVTLRLYDVLGRQVQTVRTSAEAGRHSVPLNTAALPSGTYFLRLTAGGTTKTQKITVLH